MPIETTSLQETRNTYQELLKTQARLSTGNRLQRGDNSSALIQSEQFRSILEQQDAAKQNLSFARDLVRTTDAALGEITSLIQEGESLALQASNSFIDDDARQAITAQLSEIRSSINRIANNTEFGSNAPLAGSLSNQIDSTQAVFDNGEAIELNTLDDLTSAGLALDEISFNDIEGSVAAQTSFSDALETVLNNRSRLGNLENRIESQLRTLDEQIRSNTETLSRLSDTDYLEETANLNQHLTQLEASYKTLSESNQTQGLVGRVLDLSQ